MEIIEEKPIPIVDVKKMLTQRKKQGELIYEQKVVLEYAKQFDKIKPKQLEKALKELEEMGIDEEQRVRIINVLPETIEQVKLLFEKQRKVLKDEDAKKILEISLELKK